MTIVQEIRQGDLSVRAGIVIRYKNFILTQHPTPSVKWPNPLFDIMKGHLRLGESPLNAAIRECYEESNIKFEAWKLTNPIQIKYSNDPLFLFLVNLDNPIPIGQLSCAATFVDQDGKQKPECDGYAWINPYTHIHLIQPGLRIGIMYYFNKFRYQEDCQIAGSMMGDVPQNIGSVLSLGYKNGRVLPQPKKRSNSQDYDSILHF